MRTAVRLMAAVIFYVFIACAQSGPDLLQRALELERGKGDIEGAIQLYQHIAKDFATDQPLAATAKFRLAYLNELRGQDADARKSYQEIVDRYGEQTELAAAARSRLSEMKSAKSVIRIAELDPASGMVRTPVSNLPGAKGETDRYPSWSPDSKSIAFLRTVPASSLRIGFPASALTTSAIVRSPESQEEKTYQPGGSGARFWLPDGTGFYSLSLQGALSAYLTNFAGGFTQVGTLDNMAPSDATLSRDTTRLYALLNQYVPGLTYTNWTVAIVDVKNATSGLRLARLDSFPILQGQPTDRAGFIDISHDGKSLAILCPDKDAANKDIVHISRHATFGTDGRDLTIQRGFAQGVRWTSDDRFLVYALSDNDSTWRIMRMPADRSGAPQFTGLEVQDLVRFDLSPDGKRIAFDGTAYTIRKDR